MKISDAKATLVKDSTKTVHGVLCENLKALHTATSGHLVLQQRVAELHAAFIVADDDVDMTTIVDTWRKNNSTEFNFACQATNYSGGIDRSPQGLIYHEIHGVVKQMLGEKAISDNHQSTSKKVAVKPPVDHVNVVMTIMGMVVAQGLRRATDYIQRPPDDSLQSQVNTLKRDPTNTMSESLLS